MATVRGRQGIKSNVRLTKQRANLPLFLTRTEDRLRHPANHPRSRRPSTRHQRPRAHHHLGPVGLEHATTAHCRAHAKRHTGGGCDTPQFDRPHCVPFTRIRRTGRIAGRPATGSRRLSAPGAPLRRDRRRRRDPTAVPRRPRPLFPQRKSHALRGAHERRHPRSGAARYALRRSVPARSA